VDIDINYLQAWTSFWQMIISFAMIPFNTMSFLGNQALTWHQLLTAIPEGWRCMTGHNVITPPYCQHGITEIPMHGLPPCDNCPGSWLPLMLYMTFNILFNLFTVTVIKFGGATLMFVVMTLRLPLTQFAFSIPAINDPPDKIDGFTIGGLVFILTGLIFYKYTKDEGEKEEDDFVIPPILGMTQAYSALRHERAIRIHRDAKQIRSQLYASLGIIPSPPTPRTHRTRVGLGGSPFSSRSPSYMRNAADSLSRGDRSVSMEDLRLSARSSPQSSMSTDYVKRGSGLRNANEYRINMSNDHSTDTLEVPVADR